MIARAKALFTRLKTTHFWRSYERYGDARGNVLAAGVGYFAFFSTFALLAVGFTVFGLVLGNQPALFDEVVAYIDGLLPDLLQTPGNPDAPLDPQSLINRDVLGVAGAIAFAAALFTGLGWLDAARQGIRAVFGEPAKAGNAVLLKLRDVGVLATLGLAVVASALLSVSVNATAGQLLRLAGFEGSPVGAVVLRVLAILVVLVADSLIFLVVLRLLPAVDAPFRQLRSGAVFGGIGLGVLKLVGGLLLGGESDNPVLKSAAVVVGLLVWMNLIGRLTLLAAAWAATVIDDDAQRAAATSPVAPSGSAVAGRVAGTGRRSAPTSRDVPIGPREATLPTFGQRGQDRTTLAAGVVLGAVAAVGVRVASSAVASIGSVVRHGRDAHDD